MRAQNDISRERSAPGIDSDIWSIQTGSDSTASDHVGPGRTLDIWLGRGGLLIELAIAKAAVRLGAGPSALFQRIVAPRDLWIDGCGRAEGHSAFRPWAMFASPGSGRKNGGDWRESMAGFSRVTNGLKCGGCRMNYWSAASKRREFGADCQSLIETLLGNNSPDSKELALMYTYILACWHPPFLRLLSTQKFEETLLVLLHRSYLWDDARRTRCTPLIQELRVILSGASCCPTILAVSFSNGRPLRRGASRHLSHLERPEHAARQLPDPRTPLRTLVAHHLMPHLYSWETNTPLPWKAVSLKVDTWRQRVWVPAARSENPLNALVCRWLLLDLYQASRVWHLGDVDGLNEDESAKPVLARECVLGLLRAAVPHQLRIFHALVLLRQAHLPYPDRLSTAQVLTAFPETRNLLTDPLESLLFVQFSEPAADILSSWLNELTFHLEKERSHETMGGTTSRRGSRRSRRGSMSAPGTQKAAVQGEPV